MLASHWLGTKIRGLRAVVRAQPRGDASRLRERGSPRVDSTPLFLCAFSSDSAHRIIYVDVALPRQRREVEKWRRSKGCRRKRSKVERFFDRLKISLGASFSAAGKIKLFKSSPRLFSLSFLASRLGLEIQKKKRAQKKDRKKLTKKSPLSHASISSPSFSSLLPPPPPLTLIKYAAIPKNGTNLSSGPACFSIAACQTEYKLASSAKAHVARLVESAFAAQAQRPSRLSPEKSPLSPLPSSAATSGLPYRAQRIERKPTEMPPRPIAGVQEGKDVFFCSLSTPMLLLLLPLLLLPRCRAFSLHASGTRSFPGPPSLARCILFFVCGESKGRVGWGE